MLTRLQPSPFDVIPLMTPALMPGFTAHIDAATLQPRLKPSRNPRDFVQGMLVIGLTKADRKLVNTHYRNHSKRKSVSLEVELLETDATPFSPNSLRVARPHVKRTHIRACAWICRSRKKVDFLPDRKWTIEHFVEGRYETKQTLLRMSDTGKGDEDEDGYIGREIVEREIKREKREDVFGGSGGGDWQRAKVAMGW